MLTALLLSCLLPQDPTPAAPQIVVELTPSGAEQSGGPSWSPKGATVPLSEDEGSLVGQFTLGRPGLPPIRVRLEKSEGSAHFDHLYLDTDRDGVFSREELLSTTPKEQRGKWWSSFAGEIPIPLGEQAKGGSRPYPLSLWFVADPAEPDAKPALRWSRRGWHHGQAQIGGKPAFVVLTEMRMDGVFDQRDSFGLGRDARAAAAAANRSLERHAWLDGVAYRAVAIDPDGLSLTLQAFDPGITEEQERAQADTLAPDRAAPRAKQPLSFGKDLAAALVEAQASGKRVFVDFETTWCGPCKLMTEFVYSAEAVVQAAKDVIAVKLDGDEQRELVKKYGVSAYPTMILLDAEGRELRRAAGYRGVAAMTKFFAP